MHFFFIRRIHDSINLRNLIVADHIADRRSDRHNLKYRNLLSIHRRYELLGNYSLQYQGQLNCNLPLLVCRKYINDAVNRICCSDRMQGRKYQMPGFRCCHCHIDRLIITHFTKQDHIRTLPERST